MWVRKEGPKDSLCQLVVPGSMQKCILFGSKQTACVTHATKTSLQEHVMMC